MSVYGDFGCGENENGGGATNTPLMSRRDDVADESLGETLGTLPRLERLLRCADPEAHLAIASELWRARSDADAVARLERVARESLEAWEERVRGGLGDGDERRSTRSGDDDEGLGGGGGGREGREGRAPDDRDRGGKLGGAPGRGSMSRRRAREQKEREKARLMEKGEEQEAEAEVVV